MSFLVSGHVGFLMPSGRGSLWAIGGLLNAPKAHFPCDVRTLAWVVPNTSVLMAHSTVPLTR